MIPEKTDKQQPGYRNNLAKLSDLLDRQKLNQAIGLARSGKLDTARISIENTVFLDPGLQIEAWLLLARIYIQHGKKQASETYFKKVLQVDPDNQDGIQALACLSGLKSKPPFWPFLKLTVQVLVVILLAGVIVMGFEYKFDQLQRQMVRSQAGLASMTEERITLLNQNLTRLTRFLEQYQALVSKEVGRLDGHLTELSQNHARQLSQLLSNLSRQLEEMQASGSIHRTEQDETIGKLNDQLLLLKTELTGYMDKNQSQLHEKIVQFESKIKKNSTQAIKQLSSSVDRISNQMAENETRRQSKEQQLEQIITRLEGTINKLNQDISQLKISAAFTKSRVMELSKDPGQK